MHGAVVLIIIIVARIYFASQGGNLRSEFSVRPGIVAFSVRALSLALGFALWCGDPSSGAAHFFLAFPLLHSVVRLFVVPLGIPHLANALTRVAFLGGGRNEAVFEELRARTRWGFWCTAARVEPMLEEAFDGYTDRHVRGPCLAARAMLDAIQHNRDEARELFSLVQELGWRHARRPIRAYCQAWLLADAAAHGRLADVVRIASRGPWTVRGMFMRTAALRLLRLPNAPSNKWLAFWWLLTPGHGATLSLYRAARKQSPRSCTALSGVGLRSARAALVQAMQLEPGAVTRQELRAMASAWQAVLDRGEVDDALRARAEELQVVVDSATTAAEFEEQVLELFTDLWQQSLDDDTAPEEGPLLIEATKDRLQARWLDQLESLADALPSHHDRATFQLELHWRTWAKVRKLARSYLECMPERRHMLYDAIGAKLLNHAAWLHNREQAFVLANNMFRWLLPLVPPDSEDHATLRRNVQLSAGA